MKITPKFEKKVILGVDKNNQIKKDIIEFSKYKRYNRIDNTLVINP